MPPQRQKHISQKVGIVATLPAPAAAGAAASVQAALPAPAAPNVPAEI